jgi:predicted dehydrogenase
MTDRRNVRLGFVGLGNIASVHCDRLTEAGLGKTIAAGLDVDPEARSTFADEYDASVYDDREAFYEQVDAVMVTTPNKFHETYAISALKQGLDVFIEKPLAHTRESAERIADVAEESDGFCMVGFHNRFRNPVQVIRQYQADGHIGPVTHIEADYIRRRGIPGWGSWFTHEGVAGGGSLIDIGVHAIDLSLYLLGFPDVTEVSGQVRTEFGSDPEYAAVEWGEAPDADEFSVDDSVTALIRCEDGSTIHIEIAWASNRPESKQYYARGPDAGIGLDLADDSLTLYETETGDVEHGDVAHHRTTEIDTPDDDAHRSEQDRFLTAVASGEPPGTNTVSEALTVQRVIDAIYRSSEQGHAIEL